MDYDFSRMSTRSFEQMVQALAVAVLGAGVTVFGDGPDGGREATFDGKVSFPGSASHWDGYGVIQAKFKQRPVATGQDGNWALSELDRELKKFCDPLRGLDKPAYYIFVTNVVLSPVASSGAKDKAFALMQSYQSEIGLLDFSIWDYDQLCRLIDGNSEIRTAYLAWITPGDVLATLIDHIKPSSSTFRHVMSNFVQKEIQSDQYVNLGQAGYSGREHTPLAKVFTDLPVELTDGQDEDLRGNYPGAIKVILDISSQRLDHASNRLQKNSGSNGGNEKIPGRVVFIGGPGQGKSTLSQFVCQLHRAAFLFEYAADNLPVEIEATALLIRAQCKEEGLQLPQMPRFPVRIELNRFASDLASGRSRSLFDYILRRIRHRTERELSADDLRSWLGIHPWMVILDGLDEVPPSSNRDQVLQAVQDFVVDATDCNADMLLIATTRPQGYDDDFSPSYYEHYRLVPLDVHRALRYARKLLSQRWWSDSDKFDRLAERMERASLEQATARLMTSPLQVTIMSLLVENIGQPPKERWRLFGDYYQVISRREKERDIPAAALLNTYEPDIDSIHQRVGLLLQVASESTGRTDSALTEREFEAVIERRLVEEGHSDIEKQTLTASIMDATLQRLVFLVTPQQDQVGFEIRSLQEFMAAQCLMSDSDHEVRSHLKKIAMASHWRNVFLFAAGRCFHEKQHLRDSLHTLVCEMNELDSVAVGELESLVLLGSHLALDIIDDGPVINQPAQLKLYARIALRLMELPPCPEQMKLAKQFRVELTELFKDEIVKLVGSKDVFRAIGAWRVLLSLVEQGHSWAMDIAESYWPKDWEHASTILKSLDLIRCAWLVDKWVDAVCSVTPSRAVGLIRRTSGADSRIPDLAPSWLKEIVDVDTHRMDREIPITGVNDSFRFRICDIDPSRAELIEVDDSRVIHLGWRWLVEARNFSSHPSLTSLKNILEGYEELSEQEAVVRTNFFDGNVSWPIESCVRGGDRQRVRRAIAACEKGEFGDVDDWVKAQNRWREEGLSITDLAYASSIDLPFDKNIAERGYPVFATGAVASHVEGIESALFEFRKICSQISDGPVLRCLEGNFIFLASVQARNGIEFSSEIAFHIASELADESSRHASIDILAGFSDEQCSEIGFESLLKHSYRPPSLFPRLDMEQLGARIERYTLSAPQSVDAHRTLAMLCAAGYRPVSALNLGVGDSDADISELNGYRAIIGLAGGALATQGVSEAFAKAISLSPRKESVSQALKVCGSVEGDVQIVGHFLSTLYLMLSVQDIVGRKAVFRAMQDCQRRRRGDLSTLASTFT